LATIKLIVGLGNPGAEYASTRHNVGAWLVEELATRCQQTLCTETKFHGLVTSVQTNNHKCYLLIPTTYMNESGLSVLSIAKFYKIMPDEIVVAHDELDFPAGKIRLKENGGHGGHNGLRDIINHLHTKDFLRLRIGIGHPGHKDKVTPYVLGRPSSQDYDRIQDAIAEALTVIDDIINGEKNKVMRYLHQEE
jgi:peptidyl-tRNA hydrolase, PTH1 family